MNNWLGRLKKSLKSLKFSDDISRALLLLKSLTLTLIANFHPLASCAYSYHKFVTSSYLDSVNWLFV